MPIAVPESLKKPLMWLADQCARLWDAAFAPQSYQPERYYMRGPGPKWRAKHGNENPA